MTWYVVRYDHRYYGQGVSGVFATVEAAKKHIIDGWEKNATPRLTYQGDDQLVYEDEHGNYEYVDPVHNAFPDCPLE